MPQSIRVVRDGPILRLTLARPQAYNTITLELRDELNAALDLAERDPEVRVILLDAEGPAFCAGYGLDWSTEAQATEETDWDSVADLEMIGSFSKTWERLHAIPKPTIAAVSGWCIAGGLNLVFHADLIIAAESARFGYPPSRVWGIPEAPWTWVARLGLERARRLMLTGDEFTAAQAAEWGAIVECVPDAELENRALELARRIALVPANQLKMITLALNRVAHQLYDPESSRMLGSLFDGVARHTREGLGFAQRSSEVGFREAVRERDRPFGDYGER